jgi:hypothetical protein
MIFSFPPENVLVLLQEDMYRNTFRTLRKIESFLSLPCYDYSQVAIIIDADHPPQRKPLGVFDKMKRYRKEVRKIFGLDDYHHYGGNEMYNQANPAFREWLNAIYRENNRKLKELLDYHYENSSYPISIQEANWPL